MFMFFGPRFCMEEIAAEGAAAGGGEGGTSLGTGGGEGAPATLPPATPPPETPPPETPPPAAAAAGTGDAAAIAAAAKAVVTIPENWKDSLPEDLRNDASLGPITTVEAMAKSFIHSQKMIGSDKVSLPNEHSSEDDWNNFFQKVGLPSSLEKFEVELPEGADFQDRFVTQLKEVAYKSGILPKQVNSLLAWYNTANKEAESNLVEKMKIEQQEEIKVLKTEWGQAYDDKIRLAKAVLSKTGIEDVFSFMDKSGLGDNQMLIRIFSKIGEVMKDDGILGDEQAPANDTPREIQDKINVVMNDKKHPFWDRKHSGHTDAVKQMEALHKQMHPARQ